MSITCTRMPSSDDHFCSGWACNFEGVEEDPLLGREILLPLRLGKRSDTCKDIQTALQNDQDAMTLVSGAGVSIPAEMPNWPTLVSKMLGSALYAVTSEDKNSTDLHRRADLHWAMMNGKLSLLSDVNPLESAQYILKVLERGYPEPKHPERDTKILQSIIAPMIEASISPTAFLAKNPDCDSIALAKKNTLVAAAYLMWHERGFRRAMTYNYDTLLQEYLVGVFGLDAEELVTHVESMTKKPTASRQVFHLHGCIPRSTCKDFDTFGHLSDDIILSEDSYFEVEKYGSYNWFNSVQSYYLNSGPCVFIGFSGDDYNFRRILRQRGVATRRRQQHYIVATIDPIYKDIYQSICHYRRGVDPSYPPEQVAEDARNLLDDILDSKERYWVDYDFTPIWVTISEIPEILLSFLPT